MKGIVSGVMVASAMLLASCGLFATKPIVIKADAASSVKLNAPMPAPLDLSELKTVRFTVVQNGQTINVVMSQQDFLKLYNGYVKLGIRIDILEQIIDAYKSYYEPPAKKKILNR